MVTITLTDDVAHAVYDELFARMEQIDSFDETPERTRTSAALWTALQALEAAGSGPAPLENPIYDTEGLCLDCRHAEASHSRPDPEGILNYGMGSCGNCLECVPEG